MRNTRMLVLLAAFAGLLLVAVACAAPGANPQGGGQGGGGEEAQQQVETTGQTAGGEVCDVQPPDLSLKGATVGFSQSEPENNPFRITETKSIRDEAQKRGVKLLTTNAEASAAKQISDIKDLVSRGAKILIVAPFQEQGLAPAFDAAKQANVPVFLIDRESEGAPCEDFITFMGSNFYRQGEVAADQLAKATNEKAKVAVLEGVPGASVTIDRTEGFESRLREKYPDMEIVASQTANFLRADGQQVMEQLIQANPDINAVYGQNDEMALGAIQALKDAGKNPGEDVKVVAIDGTKGAVQAIINGDMNADIETNPRFGPLAFDTIEKFLAGEPIPQKIIVKDRIYDKSNAHEALNSSAY